jgi:uncharacterized protein with HEPN domain/predicted nucleotidyltransferase
MENPETRIPDTAMAEEVLVGLNKVFPIIKRLFGIKKIGIFGAFARRDGTQVNSIELLVEFSPGFETYRYYLGLKWYLEEQFSTRISLVTTRVLSESTTITPSDLERGDNDEDSLRTLITEFELLQSRCRGISVEAFSRDTMLRHAAERSLEIAGLAVRQVGPDRRAIASEVPWKEIEEMGKVIADARFGADPHLVWHFIVTEVPIIQKQVRSMVTAPSKRRRRDPVIKSPDDRDAK